jgi:TRAP-type mannitol/chloroaromatic compound transport system permease large subunit
MLEVYGAAVPFVLLDILVIAIIMIFPPIATYLPSIMSY